MNTAADGWEALGAAGVTIVTGTDTDVGKTVATSVLAAALAADGDVVVVKPAQTGLTPGDPTGDVQLVGRLAGLPAERCLEFVRLPEPLAPTTAGRRAGVPLPPVDEHAERIARLAEDHACVVVEGAGGILVGLDDAGHGLLELADALRRRAVPTRFVVVTRAGLGTLNHTGLTVRAIRARGHDVAGLVVGSRPDPDGLHPDAELAVRCNLDELADAGGAPLLLVLPAGIGDDPAAVRRIASGVPLSRPAVEETR